MKTLNLGVFGITIEYDETNNDYATITSDLKNGDGSLETLQYDAAMDALESMVLAHFCAGVDVTNSKYLEGIEVAFESISNHYGE